MKSGRQGRNTFYNMMVLEGFIAMVWAAGAMGVYNLALQEPNAGLATGTVGVVCKYLLGHVGGIIALLGVIVLPITSGDTALRALRLSLSETLHIDQSTNGKQMCIRDRFLSFASAAVANSIPYASVNILFLDSLPCRAAFTLQSLASATGCGAGRRAGP